MKEKYFSPTIQPLLVFLFLSVVVAAAYINALNNPFMMDDKVLIFGDPLRHHPAQIFQHFLPSYEHGLSQIKDEALGAKYFRPWAHTLPLLFYAVFKEHVFFYHLLNAGLLALAALLIYVFITMLFQDKRLSFLTALLFAVHPINGVLVNYVTASVLSLMVIFSVVTLICVVRAYQSTRVDWWAMILGIFAYVNAVFCHESSVMLPAFIVISLGFVRPLDIRKIAIISCPYFVLSLGYVIFRMSYASLKSGFFDHVYAAVLSPVNAGAAFAKLIAWYGQALFVLKDIVLIKSESLAQDHAGWWMFVFVVVIVGVLLILKFCNKGFIRFGLLFLIAGFLPVSMACFFQISAGLVLEPHWMLMGSIGLFIMAAYLLRACRPALGWWLWIILIISIVGICLARGWEYNRLWSDQKKYAEYWARVSPSLELPLYFLGDALVGQEKWLEAEEVYAAAAEKSRQPFQYYYNIAGIQLLEGGDLKKAKDLLIRALLIYPDSSAARVRLGMIVSVLDGRDDIAERLFKEAIALNPRVTEARLRLAELYAGQGKFSEAVDQYEKNFSDEPENSQLPLVILKLYSKMSDEVKFQDAGQRFLKDLNDLVRLLEVAVFLAEIKENILAERYFEKVMRKNPNFKEAYMESGKFLGNLNDFDGAVRIWEQGLKKFPREDIFVNLIEQAKFLKGRL